MYPADNNDYLTKPGNSGTEEGAGGWVAISTRQTRIIPNSDLLDPKRAKFAPYLPSAAVYLCPADKSHVAINRVSTPGSWA